ncbi:Putative glycosyltransferase EpsH [Stieleria maiorica]|uniref:Glycosyltransferase EpsH n=1 Tax=Stieleria maiorica TaxID=2795974 RepID=A0A5B9MJ10_9BACT|nr:glycosyltransferase family A protein [Stieleria maiorica]QEF99634.1 Putative glycosyltransferase EpsH [Stieleria maiorica]
MFKITVGVCCYRQKQWLYRCLRSLSSQTLPHDQFEVLLVNDEPDEDLSDVQECFEEDSAFNIRLINNKQNLGLPGSLNQILRRSRGQYFVRVDADDYVSRHFLFVLSLFLDMNRTYQAVTCDYRKVNEVGTPLETLKFQDEPIACGIMYTYEALCNLNFYNEEFKMREGHDLLNRFSEKYCVMHLPFPLYRYRIHDSNRTHNADEVRRYDSQLEAASSAKDQGVSS